MTAVVYGMVYVIIIMVISFVGCPGYKTIPEQATLPNLALEYKHGSLHGTTPTHTYMQSQCTTLRSGGFVQAYCR